MSTKSEIERTEATWNPVTGCDKISPRLQKQVEQTDAEAMKTRAKYVHVTKTMIEADRLNWEFHKSLGTDECMDYCPVCHVTVANATSNDLEPLIELSDDPGAPWFDWFYFKEANPSYEHDETDDGTNRRFDLTFDVVLLEDLTTLQALIEADGFSKECTFAFKGVIVSELIAPEVSGYIF